MAEKDKKKKSKQKEGREKGKKVKSLPVTKAPETPVAPSLPAPGLTGTDNTIFDAVLGCLAVHGSAGLTTRRIAAMAGVNEVTIFRRFGNKEALLRATAARERQLLHADADLYSGDLAGDLIKLCATCADLFTDRPGLLPLIVEGQRKITDAATLNLKQLLQPHTQLLERYMREGQLRIEDPANALAALVGAILYNVLAASTATPFDYKSHVDAYLRGRATQH